MSDYRLGENKVFYDSDGKKLAGLLYIPQGYKKGDRKPALVVTRPACGVKEQTAGHYAKKLSEKGFVALAFDPKGYGESEGRTRVEDAFSIISDTKNSITYLSGLDEVDADNVFNVGICMGSAYGTTTSAEDLRIKGTAVISPILTNPEDMAKAYGGKVILASMLYGSKPLIWFLNLLRIQMYVPLAPIKWSDKLYPATPMQKLAVEYYGPGMPGDVPNWVNKINFHRGETGAITYDPFKWISKFNENKKPYFMAYATGGSRPEKLQEFFDKIQSVDKEVMVIPDAHHFDLYYRPEHVDKIVDGIDKLFKRNLVHLHR